MLAETLLFMKSLASDGDPGFDKLLLQLHAMKQIGFDINWYAETVQDEIRMRKI